MGLSHCLGLRPSQGFGQATSQIAKRLMAISFEPWPKILDIRGCAWGKPVGQELPLNPRLEDAKSLLTIPLPYHMGLSHYPSHGHGLELWPCLGLAEGKIHKPTASHRLQPNRVPNEPRGSLETPSNQRSNEPRGLLETPSSQR